MPSYPSFMTLKSLSEGFILNRAVRDDEHAGKWVKNLLPVLRPSTIVACMIENSMLSSAAEHMQHHLAKTLFNTQHELDMILTALYRQSRNGTREGPVSGEIQSIIKF